MGICRQWHNDGFRDRENVQIACKKGHSLQIMRDESAHGALSGCKGRASACKKGRFAHKADAFVILPQLLFCDMTCVQSLTKLPLRRPRAHELVPGHSLQRKGRSLKEKRRVQFDQQPDARTRPIMRSMDMRSVDFHLSLTGQMTSSITLPSMNVRRSLRPRCG
jgi:hypothetical protein